MNKANEALNKKKIQVLELCSDLIAQAVELGATEEQIAEMMRSFQGMMERKVGATISTIRDIKSIEENENDEEFLV